MRKQLDDVRSRGDAVSPALRGEVQELEIESVLRAAFPSDVFEPIVNGRNGGDILQRVISTGGRISGVILWESKRTKSWSNDWTAKNRDDQRKTQAHVGVIVTATMPKECESFDRIDGVWVTSLRCMLPLARAIRHMLIQLAQLEIARDGQGEKMAVIYRYITGSQFRERLSTTVEAFMALVDGLESEKRFSQRCWAKRHQNLDLLMVGTAGLYGDLQGIVGASIPQIEGLESPEQSEEVPKIDLKKDGTD